jgi:hypothetical protein
MNPGAMIFINRGAKKIPDKTINIPAIEKKKKNENTIAAALGRPSFSRVSEKTGIKEMLKIPSEKSFREKSKGRNAIKKASLCEDAPKQRAMRESLTTPRIRLPKVNRLIKAVFFSILLISFS